MKNSHNESGWPSSHKSRVIDPVPANSPAPLPPALRTPESPEVESLRSLLKANLPSEKASTALLERIRSQMHEHK